jgi:hypothetical protein
VYYVGANDQIFNWYFNGAHWSNGQLGDGEAAKPTSGITSVYQPANGDEQVFYTGTNGQLQSSLFNGFTWGNGVIGTGEAAQAGSALTASIFSSGQEKIYYMGADSTVNNWEGSPGSWVNYQLP